MKGLRVFRGEALNLPERQILAMKKKYEYVVLTTLDTALDLPLIIFRVYS